MLGLCATVRTSAETSSAKPPCARCTSLRMYAITSSPGANSGAPGPECSTTPAMSQPGTTGKNVSTALSSAPAWMAASARFSPAALTRISTESTWVFGSGSSVSSRTSGPP